MPGAGRAALFAPAPLWIRHLRPHGLSSLHAHHTTCSARLACRPLLSASLPRAALLPLSAPRSLPPAARPRMRPPCQLAGTGPRGSRASGCASKRMRPLRPETGSAGGKHKSYRPSVPPQSGGRPAHQAGRWVPWVRCGQLLQPFGRPGELFTPQPSPPAVHVLWRQNLHTLDVEGAHGGRLAQDPRISQQHPEAEQQLRAAHLHFIPIHREQ